MSERQETERLLTDFSRAWGNVVTNDDNPANNGVRDYIPQHVIEETAAYFKQQKAATSTTVDFGYAVSVVYSDGTDRVGISTGRGFAEIARSQCAEIGRLLISLAAPASPQSPGWAGGADTLRSAPAYEKRPNHPGWMSQAEKNDIALKKALGIDY